MSKQLPEHLQAALKTIIDRFSDEELAVREYQIRLWKEMEYYWEGFSRVYWDAVAHDWRAFGQDGNDNSNDSAYYDKPMNVFRAYLESIIAALSVTVPAVKCSPDDADNPSDILTAKGGTNIARLVYKHIDAELLWCKALFTYCTQGMIASYRYTEESDEYGSVSVPTYGEAEEELEQSVCPQCGAILDENQKSLAESMFAQEKDEFDPESDDILLHSMMNKGELLCPQCQMYVDPQIKKNKVIVTRLTGTTKQAKSRQCIKVEGGLYVRIPNWARNQKEIPYLSYCYETHYANIWKKYPKLREKLKALDTKITQFDGNQLYERWGRLNPQYRGEYPLNTPTVRNWWLRPCAFETLTDDDERDELVKRFPDGCLAVFVNDEFAEAKNESLDDHWTIVWNPLSEFLTYNPLGLLVKSVQDITNDINSLTLQTIEHGVPVTFANPRVLDFDQFRNNEILPGGVYPVKTNANKSLSEEFYTIKTATLPNEVGPFSDKINEMGQFVSGALPSLFGGAQPGGSRTAAQYAMSRNQAQQRLQTTWKMINAWWKNTFAKVIPAYIKCMLEDERIVEEQHNNFINIVIRKAQLDGKIGDVTLESADELPQTWGQVHDTVMSLIQTNNESILEAIGAPENIGVLSAAIGLPDFVMPGESDRVKQYEEIGILLQSGPVPGPPNPMTGQPVENPSVMPEFEVDNHKIEAEICRGWLVGEAGRQAKEENPEGYKNILLHMSVHIQMMKALMAPPPVAQAPNKLRPVQGGKQ